MIKFPINLLYLFNTEIFAPGEEEQWLLQQNKQTFSDYRFVARVCPQRRTSQLQTVSGQGRHGSLTFSVTEQAFSRDSNGQSMYS